MPTSTAIAKINAFENHMLKRKLLIARCLAKHFGENVDGDPLSESGFAILDLTVMYFETIEQFVRGEDSNKKTGDFSESGFKSVFPSATSVAHDFQVMMRNGIYHTGMPKDSFPISRDHPDPISVDLNQNIIINPILFVESVVAHFESYIAGLRNGIGITEFERRWDMLCAARTFKTSAPPNTTPNPMDSK